MRLLSFIGIIVFVVMMSGIFREYQVSTPAQKKQREHWILLPKPELATDGLVPMVPTSMYPTVDASGTLSPRVKSTLLFQQSLPPPSGLD